MFPGWQIILLYLNIRCFPVAVHAAIVAINEAIDKRDSDELMKALDNPTARLINVQDSNRDGYRDTLYDAKKAKEAASDAKV